MSLGLFHDTIVALSTPEARSALAIIRVTGEDAVRIVGACIDQPEAFWSLRSGVSLYANVMAEGESIDDVVIHLFRAPRSYTGEDLCELTCHGSPAIIQLVIARLVEAGCRPAEPGEFSRRAFYNGKINIEDAELISARIDASSQSELRGNELALRRKFEGLRAAYDSLLSIIALVDAEIDFGDSDHIAVSGLDDRISEVIDNLRNMVQSAANRVANGAFTVSFVGPPNVGKSSLFNALLHYERSIVSDIPGTTRDYVESFLDMDGFRVKLVDTAGIRETADATESTGISKGIVAATESNLTLLITDPSTRSHLADPSLVVVHNKSDLDGWSNGLVVSALTGAGLSDLHRLISSRLQSSQSESSSVRLSEGEQQILGSAIDQLESIDTQADAALLSETMREASSSIGQLLGVNIGEDSLNYIFSRMCIGK